MNGNFDAPVTKEAFLDRMLLFLYQVFYMLSRISRVHRGRSPVVTSSKTFQIFLNFALNQLLRNIHCVSKCTASQDAWASYDICIELFKD